MGYNHGGGWFSNADNDVRRETRGTRSERSSVSHNDEVSSTSSERYERDVAILNNCFDDIERFIARLQHTAAATRELERRRRSRKSKKKDIGDGLLSMRAKPPPEREFIDIFQKFKLSFNLLARLRAFIRDPNAPELVHFLFTPLALLVDASRDSYFAPTLPPKVVSPLLTHDANDLLTNCLTSRETELWQSLGEAWLVPREAWKYSVDAYRPVFYSGWAPEISDESRNTRYPMYQDSRGEADLHHEIHDDFEFYESDRRPVSPPPSDIGHNMKYIKNPNRDERPRSMTPMSEYQQDPSDPQVFERNQKKWLEEMKSRRAKIVQVSYPRTANNDKELTVVRGEYLEVVDDSRKWWKAMNSRGITAHVPHTIVSPYAAEEPADARRAPVPIRQGKKAHSHADLMNAELKMVLDDFRKTRPHLEIHKTPDVFIDQSSSSKQVQQWLKKKDFSERIRKQFGGVDGEKLFSLSKNQLESYCGKSEGSRLASQITIQKNVSGFKTTRSTELKNILEEQRKRIEPSKSSPLKNQIISDLSSSDDGDNVSTNFRFLQQYDAYSEEDEG